jgi:hypothetical protein
MNESKFQELFEKVKLADAHHKIIMTDGKLGRSTIEYRALMLDIQRLASSERKIALAYSKSKKTTRSKKNDSQVMELEQEASKIADEHPEMVNNPPKLTRQNGRVKGGSADGAIAPKPKPAGRQKKKTEIVNQEELQSA